MTRINREVSHFLFHACNWATNLVMRSHREETRYGYDSDNALSCTALVWRSDKRTVKTLDLREEGIEPPTAGSGIQRSTTELFPRLEVKESNS